MCEPTHSINQFPSEDPDFGSSTETKLQLGLRGKLWSWVKRIGGFFHLSQLGSGHHESLEWAATKAEYLPPETRYEAQWWDRTIRFDGPFAFHQFQKTEALECATEYANLVSIGSLGQLRNFLEVSLKNTNQPFAYIDRFVFDLLNGEGRNLLQRKLKRVFAINDLRSLHKSFENGRQTFDDGRFTLDGLIKVILGFSRNRGALVSAWADDDSFWCKSSTGMVIA